MRNVIENLRVPGVYFLPPPEAAAAALPPLDVAAFVGFAERGPLNLPVPIDDPGMYSAIFGGDLLALAVERSAQQAAASPPSGSNGNDRYGTSGRVVYANLPRAVRDFFVNGGRRCYVVRVAGRKARAARFRIPGMVALRGSTIPARLGSIAAASPGAWGGRLRLATRLRTSPLRASGFSWIEHSSGPGQLSVQQAILSRMGIQPGDVLRLNMDDGSRWMMQVKESSSGVYDAAHSPENLGLSVGQVYRLWETPAGSPPSHPVTASRLTIDGLQQIEPPGSLDFHSGQVRITLSEGSLEQVRLGDILLLKMDDGRQVLFPVEALEAGHATGGSPLSPPNPFYLATGSGLLQLLPDEHPDAAVTITSVERLRFDLLPCLGDQRLPVVTDLSFNLGGERFWGEALLSETALHRSAPTGGSVADRLRGGELWGSTAVETKHTSGTGAPVTARWFRHVTWDAYGLAPPDYFQTLPDTLLCLSPDTVAVLSGLLAPLGSDVALDYNAATTDMRAAYQTISEEPGLTYLPLGMPLFFDESDTRQFIEPEQDWEGRDGLEVFTTEMFLDPRLSPPGGAGATGSGESARTLMANALNLNAIQGRRLCGLHSLLFVDEVAIISVPDAPHRQWEVLEAQPTPLPSRPGVPEQDLPCPPEINFCQCDQPPKVFRVEPFHALLGQETPVTVHGERFTGSLETRVFFGSQSASRVKVIDRGALSCLTPGGLTTGTVSVRVENENGAGDLSEAFIYGTTAFGLDPNRAALPVINLDAPVQEAANEPFLLLHQALLYFCQARGDCLAILNLPRQYERRHCLDWQDAFRLRLGLPPINLLAPEGRASEELGEIADFSFAAIYHPWLSVVQSGPQGAVRDVPPDGAVCGLIAARERQRGVWVAPANMCIREVVGIQPDFSDEDWAVLFSRRFNLIRREPNNFRPMSAHTLSDHRDLSQISVRRLMILLRKVTWRMGMDYVFEVNHERFREGVRVVLEDLLRNLFSRGAFSGVSPDQAFRVITDARVNPPQNVDQGRFVVVIQVAPSQPMEFITVQLIRAGEAIQVSVR